MASHECLKYLNLNLKFHNCIYTYLHVIYLITEKFFKYVKLHFTNVKALVCFNAIFVIIQFSDCNLQLFLSYNGINKLNRNSERNSYDYNVFYIL